MMTILLLICLWLNDDKSPFKVDKQRRCQLAICQLHIQRMQENKIRYAYSFSEDKKKKRKKILSAFRLY